MMVGTEKVLRDAGGPVDRAETSVKSARRVERGRPWVRLHVGLVRSESPKTTGGAFSDSDRLQHIYKGSNKTRFQNCKNSQDVRCSRTCWWERDRA